MLKYEIMLKESLMDKLLNRDIVNCSVNIKAISDNGEYYYYSSGRKFVKEFRSGLKCNKYTLKLTDDSLKKLSYVTSEIILKRPGIRESLTPAYITEDDLEKFSYKIKTCKWNIADLAFSRLFNLKIFIDSNMYKRLNNCLLIGDEYMVEYSDVVAIDVMLLPDKVIMNKNKVNKFIDSFELLD